MVVGVHTGGSGTVTLRFRPALILQTKHVDIFLDRFQAVLADINK